MLKGLRVINYYNGFTSPAANTLAIVSLIESISDVIFLIVFYYLISLPLFLTFIIYRKKDIFAINWLIIFCC
jgi:hypothetical protein